MEEVKILVLDASVVVKWFNVEDFTEEALKAKELYEKGIVWLEAPELLPFEVGNALRYNPNFGVKDVEEALKALEDLQITLHSLKGSYAQEAVKLAFTYGLTLYDACYVALAKTRKGLLYTSDKEVVARVKEPFVKHVSELKKTALTLTSFP